MRGYLIIHTLLMRMQNATAILEKSSSILSKVKNMLYIDGLVIPLQAINHRGMKSFECKTCM